MSILSSIFNPITGDDGATARQATDNGDGGAAGGELDGAFDQPQDGGAAGAELDGAFDQPQQSHEVGGPEYQDIA